MKRNLWAVLMFTLGLPIFAQDEDGLKVDDFYFETRMAYEAESLDGTMVDERSGFKGQYINMRLDGQITKGLTYSYRQRLNRHNNQTFFDATDWIHLDWKATDQLSLSAGKQVVGIGGYEYDRAPIDLYYNSEFWGNIPCYQLGMSAAYDVKPEDKILLQVCNSPFRGVAGNNTYAVNLMWYATHGIWQPIWSVNMMQYKRDGWINYIALGNKFTFNRNLSLELDLMNRASSHQTFLFKDCSLMSELSYSPSEAMRCFVKYTYDVNHSGTNADLTVLDGTEMNLVSAGFEGCPLKNYKKYLRLFAVAGYSWGTNANADAYNSDKQLRVQAGLKFRLDVLEGIKKLNKRNR